MSPFPFVAPIAAFVVGGAHLAWLALHRVRERAFFAAFTVLIMLDAYLTGAFAPKMPGALATAFSVAFVILGDYRFFYLALAHAGRRALLAGALAFVVPITAQVGRRAFPQRLDGGRTLFLAYELCFLVVLVVFAWIARGRLKSAQDLRWLFAYEGVQYGLWALSDVAILSGVSAGFALRIVPDVAYYAGFLLFARWCTARYASSSS